jgi:hypothetical protein
MERPVLKNFFKDKKLKDVQETYLKTPELYAYAQSMDNYADWLEEQREQYLHDLQWQGNMSEKIQNNE